MPTHSRYPIGGFKIVYEYANYLVNNGFDITIVLAGTLLFERRSFTQKIISATRFIFYKVSGKFTPYNWFNLDRKVVLKFVWSLDQKNVPISNKYVATSMETAIYLNKYKKVNSGAKFYFIQGFEEWNWGKEEMVQTWKFPMKKIVISDWLMEELTKVGEKSVLIHNGFNFENFNLLISIEKKNKMCVGMLYHTSKLKGCNIGFEALNIVKESYPQLQAKVFGIPARPIELPSWIDYYQNPTQSNLNEIYNSCGIFIGPSLSEGFALTIPEAMICGCAIACTDIGGYTTVCKHNQTALTCSVNNSSGLADNVLKLIANDQLRNRIAKEGNEYIKSFSWDTAFKKMKKTLTDYDNC